uniref:Uncharacterized protein n=1 Tax=Rhizophora mucronata TaxID=61149 RepID=A0A2P2NQE8_RHIMU
MLSGICVLDQFYIIFSTHLIIFSNKG